MSQKKNGISSRFQAKTRAKKIYWIATQAVLRRTLDHAKSRSKEGEAASARDMELKLIQSKRDIEEPEVSVRAEKIKRN